MRWLTPGTLCLIVVQTGELSAQSNPGGNGFGRYVTSANPRQRRSFRERAVARIGPVARDFVEAQGDEAVAAIFACSAPVGVKLAEFHASGGLGKLPRPGDLLCLIALRGHGDDVALWAIAHAGELEDPDSFNAYLASPLDYALGLKDLAAGAAETRARRLNEVASKASLWGSLSRDDKQLVLVGVALVAVFALGLLWRRRQARMQAGG